MFLLDATFKHLMNYKYILNFFLSPKYRFLIGIFLILLSNLSHAKNPCHVKDPWLNTGIGLGELKHQLSLKNCKRDSRNFAACIFALQNFALYTRNPNRVGFFSDHDLEVKKSEVKGLVKKFGLYSLVELKPYRGRYNLLTNNPNPYSYLFPINKKPTPQEYYRIRNQAILSDIQRFTDDFIKSAQQGMEIMSFEEIIDAISDRIPRERIPIAVADSLNQSFKVRADAHSQLSIERPTHLIRQKTIEGLGFDFLGQNLDQEIDEFSYGNGESVKQIVGFYPDSEGSFPAAKAGLRLGDYLIAINGKKTNNKSVCEIIELIRKNKNLSVLVTVKRPGVGILTHELKKTNFLVNNVQIKQVEYKGQFFLYLKIKSFFEIGLFRRIYQKLAEFNHEKISGVILDLRGNRGGFEKEGILITSLFIGLDKTSLGILKVDKKGNLENKEIQYRSGRTLIQETLDWIDQEKNEIDNLSDRNWDAREIVSLNQRRINLKNKEDEINELVKVPFQVYFENKPTVVLIDAASASSSEVVAGALRDQRVALLVGESTYGKGTVQEKKPFKLMSSNISFSNSISGESELSIQSEIPNGSKPSMSLSKTIQVFYQPGGTTNQRVGIGADFEVPYRPDITPEQGWRPREMDREPLARQVPVLGRPISPLQKEIGFVKNCIDEELIKSQFKNRFKIHSESLTSSVENDYRLIYAKEVLSCFIKKKGSSHD